MKNRFLSSLAILTLGFAGFFCVSVMAQTTEEGPGPSEQPSAPMETGQQQPNAGPPAGMDQAGPPPGSDGQGPADAEQGQASQDQEAAKHGVARISMIHGEVSTQRGDSGDWSAATLNQPVVSGDKVSTGAGGRGELQLDFANVLRLSGNSQATIADFTSQRIQVQLGQGLATYTIFKDGEAEPEIDTPNVAIHPAHDDGSFRVEVRPDGDTIIIVRKGEAQISTPKGIADIKQGDMVTVRGDMENAQYKITTAPERDDWDRWNSDRDRMIRNADSWHHTNRYYVGSEDLDKYGRWENVPDYGNVWVPEQSDDWAPYRNGNWVYEPYYGWTWVGYEPWGWAPYHYGRWFSWNGGWAWWPGPVGGGFYRPYWAPAYVSFFGWGRGWGFGVGFGGWGGFGWLPIGPCDFFHPWWGGFRGRFGVVGFNRFGGRFGGFAPLHGGNRFSNLAHFNDPHIGRGLSTMGAGHFGTAGARGVAATREQMGGARMMTGNMPVVPTRASLSASGRAAAPSTIHNGGAQHFFGSHSTARPASFEQQTSHLQQSMQQNHFAPIAAGGRAVGGTEARGAASPGMGKPSAGTAATGREGGSFATRNGGSSGSEAGNRGQGRTFTPPNNGNMHSEIARPERSINPSNSANRPESSSAGRSEPNRGDWRPFTPPSHASEPANRGGSNAGPASRGPSGSYWNRTAPSSSRASGAGNYQRGASGSYSRPRLDMRQPIVQPRSSGRYGGYRGSPSYGGSGGYHGAPSYGGSRGGYSGSPHSAPSYGGSSHGNSGSSGGSHSSGGGGHSSGGSHSSGGHH